MAEATPTTPTLDFQEAKFLADHLSTVVQRTREGSEILQGDEQFGRIAFCIDEESNVTDETGEALRRLYDRLIAHLRKTPGTQTFIGATFPETFEEFRQQFRAATLEERIDDSCEAAAKALVMGELDSWGQIEVRFQAAVRRLIFEDLLPAGDEEEVLNSLLNERGEREVFGMLRQPREELEAAESAGDKIAGIILRAREDLEDDDTARTAREALSARVRKDIADKLEELPDVRPTIADAQGRGLTGQEVKVALMSGAVSPASLTDEVGPEKTVSPEMAAQIEEIERKALNAVMQRSPKGIQ